MRKNHDEAQADLNQWAKKKGLREAEIFYLAKEVEEQIKRSPLS